MDLEQATVHRLHRSSRLLLLLCEEYLLLLLMELLLLIELVSLERLLLFDFGVAFLEDDDFTVAPDLFFEEAGVVVVVVVKIRSNANSTL